MTRPKGIVSTPPGMPISERIAFRRLVTESGCWEWTGCLNGGYGMVQVDGRSRYVHRLVWELEVGPIPEGLEIDHLCRNRACHNPEHLEPVTPQINVRRGISPGARALRRDFCLRGHAYKTWGVMRAERRVCRLCRLAHSRAYVALSKTERAARRAAGIPVVDLDELFADEEQMAIHGVLNITPDDIQSNGREGMRTAA